MRLAIVTDAWHPRNPARSVRAPEAWLSFHHFLSHPVPGVYPVAHAHTGGRHLPVDALVSRTGGDRHGSDA